MKRGRLATYIALSTAIFVVSYLPTGAIAESDSPAPKKPSSPVIGGVRVQPRGQTFMPHSPEDDVIQRRLTIFNDQQGIEDVVLDKKLRICRGC